MLRVQKSLFNHTMYFRVGNKMIPQFAVLVDRVTMVVVGNSYISTLCSSRWRVLASEQRALSGSTDEDFAKTPCD